MHMQKRHTCQHVMCMCMCYMFTCACYMFTCACVTCACTCTCVSLLFPLYNALTNAHLKMLSMLLALLLAASRG